MNKTEQIRQYLEQRQQQLKQQLQNLGIGKQLKALFRLIFRGIWFLLRGKRAILTAPILIGLVVAGFFAVRYRLFYYDFSSGTRSGIVRKMSEKRSSKGLPFCKYQAVDMDMALRTGAAADVWSFSVDDDSPESPVVKKLQAAEQSGKRITVHYRQDLHKWWNCAEFEYFVTAVDD